VNGSGITAVQGIHMTVPKVLSTPMGARLQFLPGTPHFDDILVSFSDLSRTTAPDFESWVNDAVQGNAAPRDASLQLFSANLQTLIGTVLFYNLSPVALAPFPMGYSRVLTLSVGSVQFQ
jgi:hypothetical protein